MIKMKLNYPKLNLILIPITAVLIYFFLKYFNANNETAVMVDAIPLSFGSEFISFMSYLKMPEIQFTAIVILVLSVIFLLLTNIASGIKSNKPTIILMFITLFISSFLKYKTFQADKYIDDSIPVISKLLENEILYESSQFERGFFNNTKTYIEEYKKDPTMENKLKYSTTLFFIPDNMAFIKTITTDNVGTYVAVMKQNIKSQSSYNYFLNYSILFFYLLTLFNLYFIRYKYR